MKTHNPFLNAVLLFCLSAIFFFSSDSVYAELTSKERNILANKAKAIDLAKVLITDNSWNNLPTYKNREF